MSDTSKSAGDEVDKAIIDALHRRVDADVFSEEEDEAIILSAVAGYLEERGRAAPTRVPWLAAGGLLAAAVALAIWWLPAENTDTSRMMTSGPTQAMWQAEGRGTALQGTTLAADAEICGTRDAARACLTPGSRGAFTLDGNLELHEGSIEVQARGPIALSMVDYAVQVSSAAEFRVTGRAQDWTVSVDVGSVTLSGPDTSRVVVGAGESANTRRPEVAAIDTASDSAQGAEPPASTSELGLGRPASESTPPARGVKQTPSADELLELARSQRAAKNFRAAARSYEKLVRVYPKSKKVPATLVSLAQLYQGPLHDPVKALRHFNRYLKRGGPLAEEAHYGKIRALRSLGRAAQTEVDAFLLAYPNSAYADALGRN